MNYYPLNKYHFYTFKNANGGITVTAVSTYGGRKVKGSSKCDPKDQFDAEKGKQLAAARCNARIARKRRDRAFACYQEAEKRLIEAKRYCAKMSSYYNDAYDSMRAADEAVENLLATF